METLYTIRKLFDAIHANNPTKDYLVKHCRLVEEYQYIIHGKLESNFSRDKMSSIAWGHDLFKERGLDISKDGQVKYGDIDIPQDLNRYIRMNLDILDKWGMSDYFNTDVQLHALASAIFLNKEYGIDDPEIIYPIMFHGCSIINIYEKLSDNVKRAIDVIMLCDKLSSNYLRINELGEKVRLDLDRAVFGYTEIEFNYSIGVYLARVIAQGKSPDKYSTECTEYYYKRLKNLNPLLTRNVSIKKLGGNKKWPKRKSLVL